MFKTLLLLALVLTLSYSIRPTAQSSISHLHQLTTDDQYSHEAVEKSTPDSPK